MSDDIRTPDPAPSPSIEDMEARRVWYERARQRVISIKIALRGRNRLDPAWRPLIKEMLQLQKAMKDLR